MAGLLAYFVACPDGELEDLGGCGHNFFSRCLRKLFSGSGKLKELVP